MGNSSSSQNVGAAHVRPHGKRMTPAEKRAKQQAAGLPPVGAAAPAHAPAPPAAPVHVPASAAAPAAPATGAARRNPQPRAERKAFKELVRTV